MTSTATLTQARRSAGAGLNPIGGVFTLLGLLIMIVTWFAAGMADRKVDFWR